MDVKKEYKKPEIKKEDIKITDVITDSYGSSAPGDNDVRIDNSFWG